MPRHTEMNYEAAPAPWAQSLFGMRECIITAPGGGAL